LEESIGTERIDRGATHLVEEERSTSIVDGVKFSSEEAGVKF